MDDYTLVLNAGSSSLKFCVYRRPEASEWRLEARGQIEGIGTVAALLREGRRGRHGSRHQLDPAVVRDGRTALDALGAWLRSTYSGARRPRRRPPRRPWRPAFCRADVVTPEVLDELQRTDPAGAAPSATQSGGDRRGLRTAAQVCRRSPASTPASIAASRRSRSSCRCRGRSAHAGVQRYGFHGLSYEYIASVLPRGRAGDRRRPRHRRAPRQRRQSLRDEKPQERRQHLRVHGTRWSVHGNTARIARSRRRPLSLSEPRAERERSRDDALQEVGAARHLRHQQ